MVGTTEADHVNMRRYIMITMTPTKTHSIDLDLSPFAPLH